MLAGRFGKLIAYFFLKFLTTPLLVCSGVKGLPIVSIQNDQMDITTAYTLLAHRTRYIHATVFLVHALTTLIKVFEI